MTKIGSTAVRQIHLDFHTSEKISGLAEKFDAKEFAATFRRAHVDSVTVFARCHHGWLYYPSHLFPEKIHPHLRNRNLLFDQIDALHAEGIRAPVYITVQYDYLSARTRPEWLVRRPDGSHHGGTFFEPGFYQALCVNTGYADFLEALIGELMDMLGDRLDGFFFDIVGTRACSCAACRREMKEKGIDVSDPAETEKFGRYIIDRFRNEMSEKIRCRKKDCNIFYNAGHIGPHLRRSMDAFSHFELESLPSGWWGYLHFPATARYAAGLGKPCVGMTGKFHTEWGDFHSLKNRAALEFECLRILSFGFGISVGDQLEPCGKLNDATYRLIGDVFGKLETYGEWAYPSVRVTEAALVTTEGDEAAVPECVYGACQMLEELVLQFDIIDADGDFGKYRLLILPEGLRADENMQKKLNDYVAAGGKIIAVADGGMTGDCRYPDCYGVRYEGKSKGNDFVIANEVIGKDLPMGNEFVMEADSCRFSPEKSADVLLWANLPYFYREGENFCSHLYTPSSKKGNRPAAIRNGDVILFSWKLFTQYRKKAPYWCKAMMRDAIDLQLGENKLIRHNGPSTITCSLLDQPEKKRMALHVLHYIPVRKCTDMDIIEEASPIGGVEIKINIFRPIVSARLVPENIPIALADGKTITIPQGSGHQIVELNYQT